MNPCGVYDNIVSVHEFRRHFSLAGGVNLPKIISCVGSDGIARKQLVKVQRILIFEKNILLQKAWSMIVDWFIFDKLFL